MKWFRLAAAIAALWTSAALAADIVVFHADSLAGPMKALKAAFEAKHPGVTLQLEPGVSKQLAERILKGDRCDVFAPSSPAVIDRDLMGKAASWYVVFSANEMVVIVPKGNPRKIARVLDLAQPGVRFARVNGDKDLATGRTIEFLKRAAQLEGDPAAAQRIVDGALQTYVPVTVPEAVRLVTSGAADAAVVYYSAAVAAKNDVDALRFPASVNMSEAIRNAATVPGTAREAKDATAFVAFLLTPEAQDLLLATGQPPVVPPIRKGELPAELR